MIRLLLALTEFSFAAQSFLVALPQKSKQFLRRAEPQLLAGINFFQTSFEVTACGIGLKS